MWSLLQIGSRIIQLNGIIIMRQDIIFNAPNQIPKILINYMDCSKVGFGKQIDEETGQKGARIVEVNKKKAFVAHRNISFSNMGNCIQWLSRTMIFKFRIGT
ncbi:hypothetical protein GUJ93_ZPchr0012g18829 [Zizania palustris]|uniref:Uncharacterized protein n=1 Tax=Zizania palustris TaxID=103762 RepID=A0A8J6BUR5_ZIZPA|nr:hypothetical protein GUJ93_ZPchr0012g18829 [Zizania palustris]